jgi:hypothetical protein
MLKKEVSNFSLEAVTNQLAIDPESFIKDLEAFSCQNLTLKNAKIELDRKTLYSWKKAGLLPYSKLNAGGKDKTWGRFSFIELCWIKMLLEMRSVGIGLEKLEVIKNQFFPKNFIELFFSSPIENVENLNPELKKMVEEKELLNNGVLAISPEIIELFEQIQFSLFSCVVYSAILTRGNYVFWCNGSGMYDIVNLNETTLDPVKGIMDFYTMLDNESVIFINIKKIIADLSDTHECFSKDQLLSKSKSVDAIKIIKDLFKDNDVKEITIRTNENGSQTAWIKRHMKIEELEKEIRLLTKKGSHCDIAIKTRDGNIQYFEHTELVKL